MVRTYSKKQEIYNEISRRDADEAFQNKKYSEAIKLYNVALREIPDDKKSIVGRSKCYLKIGKVRNALDDVDAALHIDTLYKDAILQKADVLAHTGNYEMALVYYNRGAKHYPKGKEFKAGIKKATKGSLRNGRKMKLTAAGDITYFTHKSPPPRKFSWDKKSNPAETEARVGVPSATFRDRQVHPLTKYHKAPSVNLSESRANSMRSLLAGSLESLSYEDRLIGSYERNVEKDMLGKMYDDKQYLEFLVGSEAITKRGLTKYAKSNVSDVAEEGLIFLSERTSFWDSLGPLPPPRPPKRKARSRATLGSRMSHYTSSESIATMRTDKTYSSWRSFGTTASNTTQSYAHVQSKVLAKAGVKSRKPKAPPPNPSSVKFEFSTYSKDSDLVRQMTEIPEEVVQDKKKHEDDKQKEDIKQRGLETMQFVQKELAEIDAAFAKGQYEECRKKAKACLDQLEMFSEEEIKNKSVLSSTLYSCLGNCAMQAKDYEEARRCHSIDLEIGEDIGIQAIESRALGSLGRVYALMGKYNKALDLYNRKAPLCASPRETAWLFHEIGNCFLMMRVFEYARESGLKSAQAAREADHMRLQMQACVLVGVAEVNLTKFREAYQSFEQALELSKILDDKRAQDAMTKALVDVNKKMVNQLKKSKTVVKEEVRQPSPKPYNVPTIATATPGSARTNITVEG